MRCIAKGTFFFVGAAIALLASGCQPAVAPPLQPAATPSVAPAPSEPTQRVAPAAPTCLITGSAIGPLQLGMSLEQAQLQTPQATFSRTSDGEGVALVDVAVDGASLAALYAGEEDPDKAVDVTRPIEFLETFNADCTTAEGIHPGSTVVAAESAYGPVGSISRSEIESREYIQFERQPSNLQFRLDYSGDFAEGESETTRHAPGAKILSISVSNR